MLALMTPSRQDRSGGGGSRGPRRGPPKPRRSSGGGSKNSGPIEPLQPSDEPPDIKSFREWPLADHVQEAIAAMGIEVPTPIQQLAIQPLLDGRDVIAKAETGTGKTLAFGAPIMSKIDADRATVLALALCPTRELAQQVADVMAKLGEPRGIQVALIVGGEPMHAQVDQLKRGAQVVVGTPGRVLDLYGQGFLSFPWTEFVVLDEADEMLEIGFIDDVKKILSYTPEERQTLHFSATFPRDVLALARESTTNPVEIATAAGHSTVDTITQAYLEVSQNERAQVLMRLLENSAEDDVYLVFCDRRTEVDDLLRKLSRMRFSIKALHGGYDQASRFRVMSAFRTGDVKALVATDVASRGLDVNHVTHVVNFGVPQGVEDYTHRIGRTGRAGRTGKALTFVSPENAGRWRQITNAAPWEIPVLDLGGPARSSGDRRPERSDRGERSGRSERPTRSARPEREEARRPRREAREEAPPRRDEGERRPRRERSPESRPERREEPAAVSESPAPQPSGERRPRRKESTRERLARERAEKNGERAPATEAPVREAAPAVTSRSEGSSEPREDGERRPRRERGRRGGRRRSEDGETEATSEAEPRGERAADSEAEPRRERRPRREREPRQERVTSPEGEPSRERRPRREREPRQEAPARERAPVGEQAPAEAPRSTPPKPRPEPESPSSGFGAGL